MTKFNLDKDRDVIFRRTVEAIRNAISSRSKVAEISRVKVAETEFDTFVAKPDWEDALEKAKKYFERIEDYEMCQECVSLIKKITKTKKSKK
jgi:hypothetical protein